MKLNFTIYVFHVLTTVILILPVWIVMFRVRRDMPRNGHLLSELRDSLRVIAEYTRK